MLHARNERLGEIFLAFFEAALRDILAVVGDSAEDVVEASTNAMGEELVQSDDHDGLVIWKMGGWVDGWTRRAADYSCVEMVACKCCETWIVSWVVRPAC